MRFSFRQNHSAAAVATPTRTDFPPLSGADIAGMVQGEQTGGDFYHFLRANRCRVIFGMLDVAGRHEDNQGIVQAARRTFQELGQQRFAYEEVNEADAMMELCLELNLSIRKAADGVHPCAAFLGCYNEDLGTICYANAGHTPGLLRDDSGIAELPATGLPLGLFSASTYEAPTAVIQRGASLLLVSRGVVEAAHKHHKHEFGLERVKQSFEGASADNATEIASGVLSAVQEFLGGPVSDNDVTALALVRAAANRAATA